MVRRDQKSHPRGTSDKPLCEYNGKKISKFPCTMVGRYQNSHPHGFLPLYTFKVNLNFMGFPRVGMRSYRQGVRSCATRRPALHKRSCAIRGVAYLQSGWYRIAVGRHTMSSKGARSSVNVECGLRWK